MIDLASDMLVQQQRFDEAASYRAEEWRSAPYDQSWVADHRCQGSTRVDLGGHPLRGSTRALRESSGLEKDTVDAVMAK